MNNQICYSCGGKGTYLAIDNVTCWKCVGTGRDTQSDLWAFPCIRCNGQGKMVETVHLTCNVCYGTGRR